MYAIRSYYACVYCCQRARGALQRDSLWVVTRQGSTVPGTHDERSTVEVLLQAAGLRLRTAEVAALAEMYVQLRAAADSLDISYNFV